MDRLRGVEKSPKSVADCASSNGLQSASNPRRLSHTLVHVKASRSILNMQAHQLIAGFIASFDLKTFNPNIFGMKLKKSPQYSEPMISGKTLRHIKLIINSWRLCV